MAVTQTSLTSGSSEAGGTTYTTASVAPSANQLLLLAVATRNNTAVSTVTGNGLTWVQITELSDGQAGSNKVRIGLWRAMGSAPSSGDITITLASSLAAGNGVCWSLSEFNGVDTTGTNGSGAIVQSPATGTGNGTARSATLAAFTNTGNATFGCFGVRNGSTSGTPGTGFNEIHDFSSGSGGSSAGIYTEWRNDNDTSVDYTGDGSHQWAGIAIEIATGSGVQAYALTSGASTTNATSRATASVTPKGNRLILATVVSTSTALPNTPTASGNGLTWVEVQSQEFNTVAMVDRSRITTFRAMGAAPSAGAITFDFSGQTQTNFGWSVAEFSNVNTSGTNGSGAVVQSVKNSAVAATSLTVTLAAFGDVLNGTYGAFGADLDTATTPGTGFTEIHDQTQTGEVTEEHLSIQTEWRSDNDTSVDASKGANNDWGGVAIELKEASVTDPGGVIVALRLLRGAGK